MSKIVRYEFMGNWLLFWLLCISGLGIPMAVLYLLNSPIRIEEDMQDPERLVEEFRSGKLTSK